MLILKILSVSGILGLIITGTVSYPTRSDDVFSTYSNSFYATDLSRYQDADIITTSVDDDSVNEWEHISLPPTPKRIGMKRSFSDSYLYQRNKQKRLCLD